MSRRTVLKAAVALSGIAASGAIYAQSNAISLRRQLSFTVLVSNPHGIELVNQAIYFYMPLPETSTQTLRELSISMPSESITDMFGHRIVKLFFPKLSPLVDKSISVVAVVEMRADPVPIALSNPYLWMQSENLIESDDLQIRGLAVELKRSKPQQTARAIYEWVNQNLSYEKNLGSTRGALDTFIQRKGGDAEYAFLVVALARASGISARRVSGYVVARNEAPRSEDYHHWAELYLDGAWRLLDPRKGHWLTPAEQYVAFRYYRGEPINPMGLEQRLKVDGEIRVTL